MKRIRWISLWLAILALPGCAVVAVVDTAATVVVKGVGLAADGAIGAAKLTGKAVGAAGDAVFDDDDEEAGE